jgi:phospholipase/carboxylesterase
MPMKLPEQIIDSIEIEPSEPAKHSIIWLHGLGADGNDFASIVPDLHLPTALAIRFMFPHAPVMPVTINNGYKMRAWFDILDFSFSAKIDEDGIQASQSLVTRLIEKEIASGIPSENIALTTGLTYPKRLGGILALSTFLPVADKVLANATDKSLPVFIAHGTQDNVLPFFLGEMTTKALEQAGYPVSWRSYVMPHSVCAEEIIDMSQWIQKVWTTS